MVLYLSGPITSDPNHYKEKFDAAEHYLSFHKGHDILNPTVLPEFVDYEDAMNICFAMIDAADGVVMLRDWKNSDGAKRELACAMAKKKDVFYGIESVPFAEGMK